MDDDLLAQGIAAVKAGQIQQARRLLDGAIQNNPDDVRAWGWFYDVCENDRERLRCLQEVLRLNPDNEQAQQKYNELVRIRTYTPTSAPTIIKPRGGLSRVQMGIIAGMALILVLTAGALGVSIWSDISTAIFPATKTATVLPATSTMGVLSTPTLREVPSPTERILNPTWTPLPTNTPWPTRTPTPTNTPTFTATLTPTNTLTPSATRTFTVTRTATHIATNAPTNTPVPTSTNTPVPTITGTPPTPVPPTDTNTPHPTETARPTRTLRPTHTDTAEPGP
jgi:hypothetical protein